jgi:hypothetical protein
MDWPKSILKLDDTAIGHPGRTSFPWQAAMFHHGHPEQHESCSTIAHQQHTNARYGQIPCPQGKHRLHSPNQLWPEDCKPKYQRKRFELREQ